MPFFVALRVSDITKCPVGSNLKILYLAHEVAHEAGIIHRDISAGNILLWYDPEQGWHGLLNDWELSKRVPAGEAASGGRQPDRTVSLSLRHNFPRLTLHTNRVHGSSYLRTL